MMSRSIDRNFFSSFFFGGGGGFLPAVSGCAVPLIAPVPAVVVVVTAPPPRDAPRVVAHEVRPLARRGH